LHLSPKSKGEKEKTDAQVENSSRSVQEVSGDRNRKDHTAQSIEEPPLDQEDAPQETLHEENRGLEQRRPPNH